MDMPTIAAFALPITMMYAGLLGLVMVPMTLAVGYYRGKNKISLGDGGDETLIRRIRAHGNFVETVPMALILIMLVELSGGGSDFVHGLGGFLFAGRLLHYVGIVKGAMPARGAGMVATLGVILVAAGWLVLTRFN